MDKILSKKGIATRLVNSEIFATTATKDVPAQRVLRITFWVLGTKRTITVPIFLDSKRGNSDPDRTLAIWASNLARQQKMDLTDKPDLGYLKLVEKKPDAEARTIVHDFNMKLIESVVGKDFTIWHQVKNGFDNYQPFECVEYPDEDGEDAPAISDSEIQAVFGVTPATPTAPAAEANAEAAAKAAADSLAALGASPKVKKAATSKSTEKKAE